MPSTLRHRFAEHHPCAVTDVWSGRIVGCSIDSRMTSRLPVQAITSAVARRGGPGVVAGCILDSDRGSHVRGRKVGIQLRLGWNRSYRELQDLGRPPTRDELLDFVTYVDHRRPQIRPGGPMNEYVVEAEVGGGIGNRTVFDRPSGEVVALHYEFQGWLGDEIQKSSPVYIVTEALADALVAAGISGFVLDDVVVTQDPQYEEVFGHRLDLPSWRWLRLTGHPHVDDMWKGADRRLHVNDRALDVIASRTFTYGYAASVS